MSLTNRKKKKKEPRPQGRKLPRSRKVKTSAKRLASKLKRTVTPGKKKRRQKVTTSKPGQAEPYTRPPVRHTDDPPKPEPPKKCPGAEPHCLYCTNKPKPRKREKWDTSSEQEHCRNCGQHIELMSSGKGGNYYRHERKSRWLTPPKPPRGWKPCRERS